LQEKQQEAVVERCREAYLDMLQRNAAGRVLSQRARSHLKQACLAAATHTVLLQEAPVS
jgi:Holliday junction resolvasome RuvABC ATP-dependent DNA helicase subunit